MKHLLAVSTALVLFCSLGTAALADDQSVAGHDGLAVFPGIPGYEGGCTGTESRGSIGASTVFAEDYHNAGLSGTVIFGLNDTFSVFGNAGAAVSAEHEVSGFPAVDGDPSYVNVGLGINSSGPGFEDLFANVAVGFKKGMKRTLDDIDSMGIYGEAGHKNIYARIAYQYADDPFPQIKSFSGTSVGVTATHAFALGETTSFRISGHLDKELSNEAKTSLGTVDLSEGDDDDLTPRVGVSIRHAFNHFEVGASVTNAFMPDDLEDELSATAEIRIPFGL